MTQRYPALFLELKGIEGSEGAAIGKTQAAVGLDAKVEAFEKAFLRAGVKHYPSRKLWAKRALEAYQAAQPIKSPAEAAQPIPAPKPAPIPVTPLPEPAKGKGPLAAIIAVLIGLGAAAYAFLKSIGVAP